MKSVNLQAMASFKDEGVPFLVVPSSRNNLKILDLTNGQSIQRLQGHTKTIGALDVMYDDNKNVFLASGGRDSDIRVWVREEMMDTIMMIREMDVQK